MASYLNPQPSNAILDDIANIRELENYNAQSDPSLGSDFPVGAKRFINIGTTSAPKWQWQRYDGTSWQVMANTTTDKLMHNVDMLDGYHASTSAVANTIPVYNANKLLVGGITGNAATATKLATARNLQVGGIASGDAKSFNGTAAVILPINSINVNNAEDDAIVGVLTAKHGGTGRTDGAAQDVRVDSLAGETSAIANGQIGRASIISSGTHLDSIVTPGNYRVVATDGPEYGHPSGTWGNVAFLRVDERGNYINQIYTYLDYALQFKRSSRDAGASWTGWEVIGGKYLASLSLFVSKSGSDANTGLTADRPLLTIDKAVQIAKNFAGGNSGATVILRIGEGNWGSVTFRTLPFYLHIRPFDNTTPTEYSESLPKFGNIVVAGSCVQILGLVADTLTVEHNGYCMVSTGYKRIGAIRSRYFGHLFFASENTASNVWEMTAQSTYPDALISVYNSGRIDLRGYLHIRLAENISASSAFLNVSDGEFSAFYSRTVFDSSDFTFTGKKCILANNAKATSSENNGAQVFFTDVLPGTDADIRNGAIVNGYTVGQAVDNAVVHLTGTETVSGAKTFVSNPLISNGSPQLYIRNVDIERGVTPSVTEQALVSFQDKNAANLGVVGSRYNANGAIDMFLRGYSATGSYGELKLVALESGVIYGSAPTTPAGSTGTQIVTADYLASTDSGVMHTSGNETIGGDKTWNGRQYINRSGGAYLNIQNVSFIKGTTDATVMLGSILFGSGDAQNTVAGRGLGSFDCYFDANAQATRIRLIGYQNQAGSSANYNMGLVVPLNGAGYGFAPTPGADADGIHIATTAWVRDRFIISTATPSGGTNGDFWFQY